MRIRRSLATDRDALLDVWIRAVRATHTFLSEEEIEFYLHKMRAEAFTGGETWVLCSEAGAPAGFMGLDGGKVESLFLAPEVHRAGAGRRLLHHAQALKGELHVDVNEQNSAARRFYEACGFVVEGRSELDSMGKPHPILHMRLVDPDRLRKGDERRASARLTRHWSRRRSRLARSSRLSDQPVMPTETMASSELTDFLIDSVERAFGLISSRRMFGGVGIWKDGVFVAMIADDTLSIRLDEGNEAEYLKLGFVPVDPSSAGKGRKRYYEVPADIIEDASELETWLERSMHVAASAEA